MRPLWLILGVLAACATSPDPAPAPCEGGLDPCDASCTDLATDDANCGACGNACHPQNHCEAGECIPRCPGAFLHCSPGDAPNPGSGLCVDLLNDTGNCGACGIECGEGEACVSGSCQCPGARVRCGDACVDLTASINHCGQCDLECPGEYDVCTAGVCEQNCVSHALTDCFGVCTDTVNDADNCGSCYYQCGPGYTCSGATCGCTIGACGLCGIVDLGSTLPTTVSGITTPNLSHVNPPCALTGAPEATFSFTAPESKTYVFYLPSTGFWSSIYLINDACAFGSCDDGFGGDIKVGKAMTQGEQVYVVVDGHSSTYHGFFSLQVSEAPPCPDGDLGSVAPQTVFATTAGMLNVYDSSCTGGAGPERTYLFTAPSAGTYTIDTLGTLWNTTLTVVDGACGGTELACNDDSTGTQSQLSVVLTQGQQIIILVDGFADGDYGGFQLNISAPT